MQGLLYGKPTPQMLGSGMAAEAGKIMQSLPYRRHVQEAQAQGIQPMTPEEFAKQFGGAKPLLMR